MTSPLQPQPDPNELRAVLGVLRGLRVIAEGRLSGLKIAQEEYLADIYCIQRVANLLAMELSAVGRTLRRTEAGEAAAEVHQIEEILARAFDQAGLRLEECSLNLAESSVYQGVDSPQRRGGAEEN